MQDDAVLGVTRSVGGRLWRPRLTDERLALALSQRHNLPDMVGRVLAARGIGLDDAEGFLNPTLRGLMPDPDALLGVCEAVKRVVAALDAGETVAVFGDYDVDGATSAALLVRYFRALGRPLRIYIPDRIREGYGPNRDALQRLKDDGVGLVLTVDCGVSAFEPLAAAAEMGLDVIVIDHHAAEPALPAAVAVINPNRLDQAPGLGHLAAVGVCFLFLVALNRALRQAGWFETRPEPDLIAGLDLVALGTVCDVVPLTGLNRAFVAQGLKVMTRRANIGLAALADIAGLQERPAAYHLGFLLGPRVNAGGRVGEAGLGTALLACEQADEAQRIAGVLDGYNRERKQLEDQVLDAAMAQVEAQSDARAMALAWGEGWHPGVVGIVAGRLKERYNVPALVMSAADGVLKGSGRSVPGLDLGAAVIAARQAGLIAAGGGHPMAAGFTLDQDRLPAFSAFLQERFSRLIAEHAIVPELGIDGALHPRGATLALIAALERLGPFGAGNPQPRFAFAHCRVVRADVVGQNHVRCILTGAHGEGRLKAIAFRSVETPLGAMLLGHNGRAVHLAGHLKRDSWQGRDGVQLILEDAALPQ